MSAAWGPSEAWLRGWCAGQVAARVWVLLAELGTDPYDPEEEDPAMSRALESSLWELQVGTPPPGPTRTPLSHAPTCSPPFPHPPPYPSHLSPWLPGRGGGETLPLPGLKL